MLKTSIFDIELLSTPELLEISSGLLDDALNTTGITDELKAGYSAYKHLLGEFQRMWLDTAALVEVGDVGAGGRLEFLDIDRKARNTALGVIEYAERTMSPDF